MIAWCASHDAGPPDMQGPSLADLYAHLDGRPKAPSKRAVGFAANRVGRRRGPLLTMSGSEARNAKHVRA